MLKKMRLYYVESPGRFTGITRVGKRKNRSEGRGKVCGGNCAGKKYPEEN